MPAPPKAPPKPPPKTPPSPPTGLSASPTSAQAARSAKQFSVGPLVDTYGEAIVIVGTGGIGKSSLCALAPDPVFIDLEHGANKIGGVKAVNGVECWSDLRDALHQQSLWNLCKTIVIDSASVGQRYAEQDTLTNVRHEKGHTVKSIEGYGYGKGFQFVLETFRLLLSDLDAHRRVGRNVALVCHATTSYAPNPEGEDYLRYEPDLYQPPKTGRIRDAVKNWCDHMLFINYDLSVSGDRKAVGTGSRTIYPQEMPSFWAKSRTLANPIPYTKGSDEVWKQLFAKGAN